MNPLYHVCIRWIKTELNAQKLEVPFNNIGNWSRMNAYNWYVFTALPPPQIYERLRPFFHVDDSIVIFEVKPETASGWAPPWFWDWISTNGASGQMPALAPPPPRRTY